MKIYKTAKNITLFRGESVHNRGGGHYTTDKEWARQFTQSGQDKEIKSINVPVESIYRSEVLPKAYDESDFDRGLSEAVENGFRAFWLDEGNGQPNSVYFLR